MKEIILIVDDDLTSRLILKVLLIKKGYGVILAENGKTAYEILTAKNPPKVAIIDWVMPIMDGSQLCEKLRTFSQRKNFYLIMLTSKSDPNEVVKGIKSGADDYIIKPPHPDILCARIEIGLNLINLHREMIAYTTNIEKIAEERAVQLAHSDRMASLGVLSAGIAHEINNPTSFVSINIQNLKEIWILVDQLIENKLSAQEKNRLSAINNMIPDIFKEMDNGIARITEIVKKVKKYSHSESGIKKIMNVNKAIKSAIAMTNHRTKNKLFLKIILTDNLPNIKCNEQAIEQVIINLIINATDAIEEHKIANGQIDIESGLEKDNIFIKVSDNGPGISDNKFYKLFDPFYTTKPPGKGTGLGLSISKTIIENHKGKISVIKRNPNGIIFKILLPTSTDL